MYFIESDTQRFELIKVLYEIKIFLYDFPSIKLLPRSKSSDLIMSSK